MIYANGVNPLRRAQETVSDVAGKLAETAADTRAAMGALAVLGIAALCVAVIALVIGLKARAA